MSNGSSTCRLIIEEPVSLAIPFHFNEKERDALSRFGDTKSSTIHRSTARSEEP